MFQDRFAENVENGTKRQTIRKTARCKVGDTLSLRRWSGKAYRSKQKVLATATCTAVLPVCVSYFDLWVDGKREPFQHVAVTDGFRDYEEMRDWFQKVHGLPFRGELIRWELIPAQKPLAPE